MIPPDGGLIALFEWRNETKYEKTWMFVGDCKGANYTKKLILVCASPIVLEYDVISSFSTTISRARL